MKRKTIILLMSLLALVVYMLMTDPFIDDPLSSNIPYGIGLVLISKVFLLSVVLITLLSYLVDAIVDKSFGVDEKLLVQKANDTPTGAGYILMARSIIILAGSIIILGVLIYC